MPEAEGNPQNIGDEDSLAVQHLFHTAYELERSQPDSAINLYKKALKISRKIGYPLGEGRSLQYIGIVLSDQGEYELAGAYYQKALPIFKSIDYTRGIGGTLINLGNIAQFKGDYQESTAYYLRGIKVFEGAKDTTQLIICYNNLGSVFSFINQPATSLAYYQKALALGKIIGDSIAISDCYINISKINLMMGDSILAYQNALQVINYSTPIQDHYLLMLGYNNLSEAILHKDSLERAFYYASLVQKEAKKVNIPYYQARAEINMGKILFYQEQYDDAAKRLHSGLLLAEKINSKELISYGRMLLARTLHKAGRYEEAFQHLRLHKMYDDSLFNENQAKTLHELEEKYQTEKKDREIAHQKLSLLQNEQIISRKNQYITLSALSALLLMLGLFVSFYYFRTRQKLQQQQMLALQKETELKAMKAMMAGEEKERSRIAKDLHDGLSGLLGTVKLRFSAFKEVLTKEIADYEQAMELLDHASREVREISHNLMPEILIRYGLVEGLKNYFSPINQSGTLAIDFQVYGLEQERLPSTLELTIYRVIQELINNIIKHSQATEVLVQLEKNDTLLLITVEDNGIGFIAQAGNGAGLESIKTRIDYLNGQLDIHSEAQKGTSVYIEIVLDKLKTS